MCTTTVETRIAHFILSMSVIMGRKAHRKTFSVLTLIREQLWKLWKFVVKSFIFRVSVFQYYDGRGEEGLNCYLAICLSRLEDEENEVISSRTWWELSHLEQIWKLRRTTLSSHVPRAHMSKEKNWSSEVS